DVATFEPTESSDDEPLERGRRGEASCELGGYLLEATRSDAWDTIVDLLAALDSNHPDYFHRLMRGCRQLSNEGFELDELHDLLATRPKDLFAFAPVGEPRREQRGFFSPAQARAFLHDARRVQLKPLPPPTSNPIARAFFRGIAAAPPLDSEAA